MKVILFGATGMIGQGVLRECRRAADVERVLVIGRTATGVNDPKVEELVRDDLYDLAPVADQLVGYDACLFCLGVSSVGMSEDAYRRITYDLTLGVARTLVEVGPGMRFVYLTGAGTDSTEQGRTMWARVKGQTENALLALPLDAYMFRPGYIQPMHGVKSKTRLYRSIYAVMSPLYPVLRRAAPKFVTSNDTIGRAMLAVARAGFAKHVLETVDINALGN
jgi:uncharacterized protein YbjT (DUF2867 family)